MAITDLIARGVQSDPAGAYLKGYGAVEDIRTAQQNRAIQQQKMDLARQEYAAQQQQKELVRGQKYATAIAPILQDIKQLPIEQRQQAYTSKLPIISQIAGEYGFDTNQISPQYDDAKATAVVSQYFEPSETREVKRGEDIVTEEYQRDTGEWKEIARGKRSAKQRIETTQIEPTKKVASEAQTGIVDTSSMLDQLFELSNRVKSNPDQLTIWGSAGGTLLKFGERLGVPLPEGGEEYLRTRQGISNYANKIYNTYRRMITGSQASKFELGELKSQAPTTDDSMTTMNQKIKDWTSDTERLRVRYRKIIEDGFTPAGSDKEGNVYFEKNGKKYEISQIQSLENVPVAENRVIQIEQDLRNNNPNISDQAVFDLVMQQMNSEGYDTRRWKFQ